MNKFKGVIPPVVTPLTSAGELDKNSFKRSIDRMIEAGVNGLFILGSSGEVAFSTDARREEILRAAKEIVGDRVPLLAGCIDTETLRVIEHAKVAEKLGYDAIVATAPFYALGGITEIERHFRKIHEATSYLFSPTIFQFVCTSSFRATLLIRLGKDGVIAGVKDSSGDDVAFRFLVDDNKEAGHPRAIYRSRGSCRRRLHGGSRWVSARSR